jgi:hypothetical protein
VRRDTRAWLPPSLSPLHTTFRPRLLTKSIGEARPARPSMAFLRSCGARPSRPMGSERQGQGARGVRESRRGGVKRALLLEVDGASGLCHRAWEGPERGRARQERR